MREAQLEGIDRGIFDVADSGLIVVDAGGRVRAWNAWLASTSAISPDAAIGKTLDELFPRSDLVSLRRAIDSSIVSGASRLLTHSIHPALLPLRTRAGETLVHDVRVHPVMIGRESSALIQIDDVTLAVKREAVLRERQNARYDAVVQNATDAIFTLDEGGVIQVANPAATCQFGYSAEQLIGRHAAELFGNAVAWTSMLRAVQNKEALHQPVEVVARRRDGSPTHLEVSFSRWLSQSNVFVTAILRDVNDRRVAEEKMRVSEAQFRTLAQAMPNHVWTARPDGQLDWFNDRVYDYSGAAVGTLDGAAWGDLVYPDDLPEVAARWSAASSTGTPYEAEFRLRRWDGAYRWHIARALPIRGVDEQILRWIGSNTDIADQKAASEALADINATLEQRVSERTTQLMEAEEALRQSQKMEAVGQLTGGIAHDFNNLLQGIMGALNLIKRRLSQGRIADVDRFLSGALESADRAATLTHRLLAFSRRQPIDPKAVDIRRLIDSVEALLRQSIGDAVELRVECGDPLWLARCDENQLENALLNLAINARDAMPEGGALAIHVTNRTFGAGEARKRELMVGDYVSLRVTDTGVGMPPQVKSRAFDPFYTTKPIGKGTGLGLSMVYGFVRQAGGAIWIESEPGKGTAIEICLPRFSGEFGESTGDAQPDGDLSTGRREVVLVVEDQDVVRVQIVELLREIDYAVLESAGSAAALTILESSQRIDLLVSDIGLPGLNGRQLADAARIKRPGLKILFITGYAEGAAGSGFLEPGMEIVSKPFSMEALAKKVREMIPRLPPG